LVGCWGNQENRVQGKIHQPTKLQDLLAQKTQKQLGELKKQSSGETRDQGGVPSNSGKKKWTPWTNTSELKVLGLTKKNRIRGQKSKQVKAFNWGI